METAISVPPGRHGRAHQTTMIHRRSDSARVWAPNAEPLLEAHYTTVKINLQNVGSTVQTAHTRGSVGRLHQSQNTPNKAPYMASHFCEAPLLEPFKEPLQGQTSQNNNPGSCWTLSSATLSHGHQGRVWGSPCHTVATARSFQKSLIKEYVDLQRDQNKGPISQNKEYRQYRVH